MSTEQQDWNDDRSRRIQIGEQKPKLVEMVKRTVTGGDQRDGSTFYRYDRLGVYSTREKALEALLKLHPEIIIQPLEIDK
jgi:hypothetical protein